MGACDFYYRQRDKTAREAFRRAVEDAQWEYGHGGYSGTIAEKGSFVMIHSEEVTSHDTAYDYASRLIEECDRRIWDKWGPAGCIEIPDSEKDGTKEFLFFGMASS
jgi:hypothetical protein